MGCGLPKTRQEVMQIAENVVTAKGMLKVTHILECNTGMSLRASDATAGVWICAMNE